MEGWERGDGEELLDVARDWLNANDVMRDEDRRYLDMFFS